MAIYNAPYPLEGVDSATKSDVERIITLAEMREPGFCERNGIELTEGQLPLGKIKHKALIARLWPVIPREVKSVFLIAQYICAVG